MNEFAEKFPGGEDNISESATADMLHFLLKGTETLAKDSEPL